MIRFIFDNNDKRKLQSCTAADGILYEGELAHYL